MYVCKFSGNQCKLVCIGMPGLLRHLLDDEIEQIDSGAFDLSELAEAPKRNKTKPTNAQRRAAKSAAGSTQAPPQRRAAVGSSQPAELTTDIVNRREQLKERSTNTIGIYHRLWMIKRRIMANFYSRDVDAKMVRENFCIFI